MENAKIEVKVKKIKKNKYLSMKRIFTGSCC